MLQEVISQVNAMVDTARNNTFRYSSKHPYCVRRYTFGMLKTTTMCHIPDFVFDPARRGCLQCAYLLDVGKLLTPKSLLNKRGPLTPGRAQRRCSSIPWMEPCSFTSIRLMKSRY